MPGKFIRKNAGHTAGKSTSDQLRPKSLAGTIFVFIVLYQETNHA